ncbi:MAG: hypothetical protein C4547_11435 [Phycisphaerales bacterium]|nr:MAG: hypothetical protein C4547_11435 [Phycisphaerales bacterium]
MGGIEPSVKRIPCHIPSTQPKCHAERNEASVLFPGRGTERAGTSSLKLIMREPGTEHAPGVTESARLPEVLPQWLHVIIRDQESMSAIVSNHVACVHRGIAGSVDLHLTVERG